MVGFPKKGESYHLLNAKVASTLSHKMIKLGLPVRYVISWSLTVYELSDLSQYQLSCYSRVIIKHASQTG